MQGESFSMINLVHEDVQPNRTKNEDYIIRTPKYDRFIEEGGVGKLFYEKMKGYGDAIVQICEESGEEETYASLLQRSVRASLAMKRRGIQTGDVVYICATLHIDTAVPFLASLFLGAVPASLDLQYPSEWKQYFSILQPKIVFADADVVGSVNECLTELYLQVDVITFGAGLTKFSLSHKEDEFVPEYVTNLKSTVIPILSSGTTGPSKVICSNHHSYLLGAYRYIDNVHSPKRVLLDAPLACGTIPSRIAIVILTGGSWVLLSEFDPKRLLNAIEKYKITFCVWDPIAVQSILNVERKEDLDTSSLKTVLVTGNSVSREELMGIRRLLCGAKVIPGYGLSEFHSFLLLFNPMSEIDMSIMEKKLTSIGKPMSGFQYKVTDPNSNETLGPHQKGELLVKADYFTNGYLKANMDTLDSEGFFKTGDIVYYDEDYCFYFVDRISQLFVFRQTSISPVYLENVVKRHPDVYTVAVVGVPHPEGLVPTAVVVLKCNAANRSNIADDIQCFVDGQVDDNFKLRGGVKIAKNIPRTASNKIKRKLINKMIISGEI